MNVAEPSPSSPVVSRRPGLIALVPFVLLLAVSGWELVVVAGGGASTGADSDWKAAGDAVRAGFVPGELVVAAPPWADPLMRREVGDLITVEAAARMDAARFPAIWELSIRGAVAPEVAGLAPNLEIHAGPVRVRRYPQQAATVLTDFVAAFPTAKAAGDRDGGPSVELEEVGFAPHRCVRIIPRPNGTATLTYEGVALGSTLVGYVGLADVFERRDIRDPARLEVLVNGTSVASTTVGVDSGWTRWASTTKAGAATVEFRATALGPKARRRLVCFAAEARQ